MNIGQYLKKLASLQPTPGGGSAAALSGSIAAALLAMVAKLSQQNYPAARNVSEEAEKLADTCRRLAKKDEKAFNEVVAAYKLPKETEREKQTRSRKIENALKKATDVPMDSAKASLEVVQLVDNFLEHANPGALSDLGVAALLAQAASEGAILNVLTNITSLRDPRFSNNYMRHAEAVVDEGRNRTARILKEIHATFRQRLRK